MITKINIIIINILYMKTLPNTVYEDTARELSSFVSIYLQTFLVAVKPIPFSIRYVEREKKNEFWEM